MALSLFLVPMSLMACGPAAKINGFADRMCACKDQACAAEVSKEYDAYVKDNPVFKGSTKQEKKLSEGIGRMLKCRIQISKPDATDADLPQ